MQSNKFQLNKQDFKKIAVGALVALGGALLTYAAQVVSNTNFGVYTPFVVVLAGVLVNAGRKALNGK